MTTECQITAERMESGELSPFLYLKEATTFLSNRAQESEGRELVIRALENKEKFSAYEGILKNLVRKSGLFPYLNSEFEEKTIEEEFLIDTYRSSYSKDFILHSMQYKIYNLIMDGKNVILSAPTSMGKSVIVDSIIDSKKFERMVLVVPTIALIDETRRRISRLFGNEYEVIHHNSQSSRKEKTIYILTQERVNERDDIENIDLFIIDEFYKLAFNHENDERATSLNIALSKLLTSSKQFYMIGPNIDSIRGIDKLSNGYFFIPSEFNTVAVDVKEYDIPANSADKKNKILKEILKSNNETIDEQTIIYCKSPASAAKISRELIRIGASSKLNTSYTRWVEKHYSEAWSYTQSIKNGIGIHHGTLPRAIQQRTIDLFNNKKIKFLICTSTIIEGVNTVAENVIIYDNRNGTSVIDRFTHNNIKGRAGRMKVHYVGRVYCLEKIPPLTIDSRVVDVPLGTQDEDTPYNMLAGIQPEHIGSDIQDDFDSFIEKTTIPQEILSNHATYKVDIVRDALSFVAELSNSTIKNLCKKGLPRDEAMDTVCSFIKEVEAKSLRRVGLAFESDEFKNKVNNYLFSKSLQDYIDDRVEWLYNSNKTEEELSSSIDRELKIIRNIFSYTIPKALSLLQDILNHTAKKRDLGKTADFSVFIAIFENNHLPGNLSALEEMGIPNQTLSKFSPDQFKDSDLNSILRYLKWHIKKLEFLTRVDKQFIRRALT